VDDYDGKTRQAIAEDIEAELQEKLNYWMGEYSESISLLLNWKKLYQDKDCEHSDRVVAVKDYLDTEEHEWTEEQIVLADFIGYKGGGDG